MTETTTIASKLEATCDAMTDCAVLMTALTATQATSKSAFGMRTSKN